MKLIDRQTGACIADIMTNHSMSVDEALELMGYAVADEGQIYDVDNQQLLNAWYDDLDMVWEEVADA